MEKIGKPVREWRNVTKELFDAEILPLGQPAVLRGVVDAWPANAAGRRDPKALVAYLATHDSGAPLSTYVGAPGIGGRFFYRDDMDGFNFDRGTAPFSAVAELLLSDLDTGAGPSIYSGAASATDHFPTFAADNPMPLLADQVEPRVWVGNAVVVAAHHDPSENIACVVAGGRRFTLFPPDQIANLYMGPFDPTPAGATISMVDFDAPDLDRYPRFAEAMRYAMVVDMEPGDALYIPYMWWHHVRSTERMNMLVNYWWTPPDQGRGRPTEAMMHAIVAVRDMPAPHRAAWRALFDHYVFEDAGPAGAHLPLSRRGALGVLDAPAVRMLRAALARAMGRP